MANYHANEQVIRQLSPQDRAFLLSVYEHRCLDEALAYQHFYRKENVRRSFTAERLKALISYNLLEEIDYGSEYPALFLTSAGNITLRTMLEQAEGGLSEGVSSKHTWLQAAQLRMGKNALNHQIRLNSFALDFETYARGNLEYCYYDEKHMPTASYFMMSDAVIELPECYLFLEMDMNSENGPGLAKKWDSYRTFLNGSRRSYADKPVILLFIMEGVARVEMRRQTVIKSLERYLLDLVSRDFDIYIGTPDELHDVIRSRILGWDTASKALEDSAFRSIHQNFGYSLSTPSFLDQLDAPYSTYARKLNEKKKIEVVNGIPQEFLVDSWLDGRVSMLKSMLRHRGMLRKIKEVTGRPLPYLIIVPSEKWIYQMLKKTENTQPEGVYFTTPERLSACNWGEALFYIDQIGNLKHYTDASLRQTVHEKRMAKS